jgi:predicted nucleic acid-binding protein
MKYLLDNDVFYSSLFAGHANHRIARQWVDIHKPEGWGIASETYLAALRLLMNPLLMGGSPLSAKEALQAVETELAGVHAGRVVCARNKPERKLLEKASGHRQIMDIWQVQIARDTGAKLATCDHGTVKNWPENTIQVSKPGLPA